MIPGQFEYVRPTSLDETLRILDEREGDAKLLSGGYSLLPLLKLRLAQPAILVDLRDVSGLDRITRTDAEFRIGSRVTHRRIHEDAGLAASLPVMHDAAGGIGDPQVRNWGTIGGSVAHADPSSDWPAVLIALGASIVCVGLAADRQRMRVGANIAAIGDAVRERVLPARGFFLDTFSTAIEPAEVLTEVRIAVPGPRSGGAYTKLERRAGDFATVGSAVQLTLGADGRIARAGIGLTAVSESPMAATEAEAALVGQQPTEEVLHQASAIAAGESRPVSDSHGPADYKRAMVAEVTMRSLRSALARAQGA